MWHLKTEQSIIYKALILKKWVERAQKYVFPRFATYKYKAMIDGEPARFSLSTAAASDLS